MRFCQRGSRNTGLLMVFLDPAVLLIATMLVLAGTFEEEFE